MEGKRKLHRNENCLEFSLGRTFFPDWFETWLRDIIRDIRHVNPRRSFETYSRYFSWFETKFEKKRHCWDLSETCLSRQNSRYIWYLGEVSKNLIVVSIPTWICSKNFSDWFSKSYCFLLSPMRLFSWQTKFNTVFIHTVHTSSLVLNMPPKNFSIKWNTFLRMAQCEMTASKYWN